MTRAELRPCGHPYGALSLSSAGKCCREIAYDIAANFAAEVTPLAQARMDLGHRYEALALARLADEGVTITDQQRCVEFAGVPGHIDAIGTWPDQRRMLVEIKSGGKRSVDDFVQNGLQYARSGFVRGYYDQVQAYMTALALDDAMVVYCERPDGEAEALEQARVLAASEHSEVRRFLESTPPENLIDYGSLLARLSITSLDPLDSWPVQLTRVERREVQRSDEAAERIASRLRLAQGNGAMPPEVLREHALRDDGTLPSACAWCDHKRPCWGELLTVRVGRWDRLMPASEVTW